MGDLAAACADLAAILATAAPLLAEPDTDGTTAGGHPGPRPPWNPAAADALTTAAEGARRLEASLRFEVTGHHGPRRGGSDANTMAALRAIERLAAGLPERHDEEYDADGRRRPCRCPHCTTMAILARWARQVRELPAIDQAEPWRRVPAACPYCGCGMLRVAVRSGRVTCLRYGACADGDGNHPQGRMDVSRLTGDAVITWNDGLVTP